MAPDKGRRRRADEGRGADEGRKRTSPPSSKRRTGHFIATAAEKIGCNEDLTLEILYHLPIISLMKFKMVRKSWYSLISDPLFPGRYAIRQPPPDSYISAGFLYTHVEINGYRFTPLNDAAVLDPCLFFIGKRLRIIHCCNGLFLCEASDPNSIRHIEYSTHAKYYVCNPLTEEFVQIRDERTELIFSGLAFDPSKSPHYKVVVIERLHKNQPDARVHIYSSQTRMWRYSNLHLLPNFSSEAYYYEKVAFWKGALHWVGSLLSTFSFDVETEFFWETPRPNVSSLMWTCLHIFVSCNHLKLIESKRDNSQKLRILEMGHHYQQWLVKYQIDLSEVLQLHSRFRIEELIHPLHLFNGERESGEEELLLHVPGKIISYHLRDGKCKDICQVYAPTSYVRSIHVYSYTLSSVRPP